MLMDPHPSQHHAVSKMQSILFNQKNYSFIRWLASQLTSPLTYVPKLGTYLYEKFLVLK